MANLRGAVEVSVVGADGRSRKITLFFGMSAIETMTQKYGDDFLDQLADPAKVPVALVLDIFRAALKRFHASDLDDDPYLVDDVVAQNGEALVPLIRATFPESDVVGNAQAARPKRKSTSSRG